MNLSLTSKHCKEAEHDGVEKAEAHGQCVFMDDSGDDEHGEHGSRSEFPVGQLQGSERDGGWEFRGQAGSVWILCQ